MILPPLPKKAEAHTNVPNFLSYFPARLSSLLKLFCLVFSQRIQGCHNGKAHKDCLLTSPPISFAVFCLQPPFSLPQHLLKVLG